MDVVHRLNGIDFVWDLGKAASNLQKHEVAFETSCEAFFDPFIRLIRSEVSGDEERETAIGMTRDWQVLVVTYTIREEAIRLISARPATGQERNSYENESA